MYVRSLHTTTLSGFVRSWADVGGVGGIASKGVDGDGGGAGGDGGGAGGDDRGTGGDDRGAGGDGGGASDYDCNKNYS
jgi:hypothetical protein